MIALLNRETARKSSDNIVDVCIVDPVDSKDSKDSSEDRHVKSTKSAPIMPRPGVQCRRAARKRPVLYITLALAPTFPYPSILEADVSLTPAAMYTCTSQINH